MYHSFPKVRKTTAEKLYTGLLTMEDPSCIVGEGNEDKFERAMEILSQTEWNDPLKSIVQGKEELYEMFGMKTNKVSNVGGEGGAEEEEKKNQGAGEETVQIRT